MNGWFLEAVLFMTNCNANAMNSIAKLTNSTAKPTNSIAKPTNSIAIPTNSIAKATNSIAKTCKNYKFKNEVGIQVIKSSGTKLR